MNTEKFEIVAKTFQGLEDVLAEELKNLGAGEGQMFVDEKLCGVQIPFYQADVESYITRIDELTSDREMVIPQLTGCDLAMLYNGKAMGYSIPSGSIVFLKKMTPEEIIPGRQSRSPGYRPPGTAFAGIPLRTAPQPGQCKLPPPEGCGHFPDDVFRCEFDVLRSGRFAQSIGGAFLSLRNGFPGIQSIEE